MQSKLIVMLTHKDVTVSNAAGIFTSCKDMPVECWGFKDVGLCKKDMADLFDSMKAFDKKTFLEVVSYTEEECMRGARLAVELSVDYLMGTVYYKKVFDYLASQNIAYLPFCGKVTGSPSVLEGDIEEIIHDAQKLLEMGIFGIDLLAFRHKDGEMLARRYIAEVKKPVVIAGSIGSKSRLEFINEINPWGYTMGSALFTHNFNSVGDFRQNLEDVLSITNALN